MTYRDPDDPTRRGYSDPATPYQDADEAMRTTYVDSARRDGWTAGNIIGAIVVLAIIVAAIAYVTNRSSITTAGGPSTTHSEPSTTGQRGPAGTGR